MEKTKGSNLSVGWYVPSNLVSLAFIASSVTNPARVSALAGAVGSKGLPTVTSNHAREGVVRGVFA